MIDYTPLTLEKATEAVASAMASGRYIDIASAVLDAISGDIAAQALQETADVLARPRVLWFGDDGVTVLHEGKYATLEQYQAPRPKLVEWLRDRAARLREGGQP